MMGLILDAIIAVGRFLVAPCGGYVAVSSRKVGTKWVPTVGYRRAFRLRKGEAHPPARVTL